MASEKSKSVIIWLFIGLFMILMQVFIGGITRLTGSGLSITKWDIITGTFPPMSDISWHKAFDLYKETPQYHKINKGFSLEDFKFIFFWEYIHRLWARTMGFVFLIPCLYFWFTGRLSAKLKLRLVKVFLLAVLVATFGWLMVASGLIERPWVNAYKLSFHLSLALILFLYLLFVFCREIFTAKRNYEYKPIYNFFEILTYLVFLQIFLGGMMAGMKAALLFPTWPKIGTEYLPSIILDSKNWIAYNFEHYDKNLFFPALVQWLHRSLAYIIFVLGIGGTIYYFRMLNITGILRKFIIGFCVLLTLQVVLGIFTLLYSIGSVPIWFGVFHQLVGFLTIAVCLIVTINAKFTN